MLNFCENELFLIINIGRIWFWIKNKFVLVKVV